MVIPLSLLTRSTTLVKVDRPLWSYPQPEIEEDVAERIGSYVAHRIEDGSTLQIGIGRYPAGVLKHLHSRKNLGIHSDVKDGELKSRIRPKLREGEGVTISRGDVNYVATEWGITNLFAKSIQERALRLIEITHPIFRDWLLAEAKELKYIREDYVLESKGAYPEGEERLQTLRSGESVLIRPAKGSDFGALRIFFYRTNPEDIHSRFHGPVSYLPESKYDFLVNVDYEKNMAFAAVVGGQEDGRIVSISNYVYDEDTDLVEFSHLTHQDWQGKGLCGRLRQRLIEYPQSKNERGFLEIITKVTQ